MGAPNVPTAAQLAQLATYNATTAAAIVTYNAAVATLTTAQAALINAQFVSSSYAAYIYGGQKPGIIDQGGPSVT